MQSILPILIEYGLQYGIPLLTYVIGHLIGYLHRGHADKAKQLK